MKQILRLTLMLILVWGCTKSELDRDITQPIAYNVPAEFQVYIDSFLSAGQQRGIDSIAIDNLVVDWEAENENLVGHTCAVCYKAKEVDSLQKYIIIKPDCWNGLNDHLKEVVMFHELGHCYLNRSHKSGNMGNGYVKSIMNKTMSEPLWADTTSYRRAYYLDELFDPDTDKPEWADQ